MRLPVSRILLFGALVGLSLESMSRSCRGGKCSDTGIIPRGRVPGIPPKPLGLPKSPLKPAAEFKPGSPGSPGRTPEIAPSNPEVKPPPAKPPTDANRAAGPAKNCKRADQCSPDAFVFQQGNDQVDFALKGQGLQNNVRNSLGKNKIEDHGFLKRKGDYQIKAADSRNPEIKILKQLGIDVADFLSRPQVWRRYEVFGFEQPKAGTSSIVDMYISVEYKAIIRKRIFRYDNSLYSSKLQKIDNRLQMSEWIYQLWKEEIKRPENAGKAKIEDLKTIIVVNIDNAERKSIIRTANDQLNGGADTQFVVRPTDGPIFNALAYSSSGRSNFHMLTDHNSVSELNNLVPKEVIVSPASPPHTAWVFGRGP
ncbi:hypothetical protein PRK78_003293 [Emydomyces testavorans]|uniref:Uncharacterized protein n=1 Tax=Emydomyces testavorans TaxID=2070801 RepID=A0AAF0DFS3_9EURO|nr:hypothetical protein PRK78_003293 [Emydomyces testavorans]